MDEQPLLNLVLVEPWDPSCTPWPQSRASQGAQSHEMATAENIFLYETKQSVLVAWKQWIVESLREAAVLVRGVSWRTHQLARLLSANPSPFLPALQPPVAQGRPLPLLPLSVLIT